MPSAKATEIKDALERLVQLGDTMELDLRSRVPGVEKVESEKVRQVLKEKKISFEGRYQSWYTEALRALKQLLPERLVEFTSYYEIDPKRKRLNTQTFSIQDWLLGIRATPNILGEKPFEDLSAIIMRFGSQIQILESAKLRFDSRLFDIRQLVEADLFDSEIDGARELLKNGFLRGSGVIAGVVLEKHLSEVCESHQILIRKRNPTIGDFNDALKEGDSIDVPTWRFIQRLGDLRNLCGHNRDREPTPDEATELLDGVAKIVKSVF
jgi:hypothetical protein